MNHPHWTRRSLALAVVMGLAVVALTATPRSASAQGTSEASKKKLAKRYVDAAIAAQEAGEYDQAIDLYTKAYDVAPHPILWFNIGQAHRLAGRDEQALTAYQRYLADAPDGPKAAAAQAFIDEIQPRLDHARAEAAEQERLAAEAEAQRQAAEEAKAEAERQRLAAEAAAATAEQLRREAEEAKRAREAAEAAEPDEPEDEGEDEAPAGGARKKLGLIVGGSGVLVAATGLVFGALANSAWSDAKDLCGADLICDAPDDTTAANAHVSDARLRGNVATALVGVGGAAIVTGVILYLTAPSGRHRGERAVAITPVGGGAIVTLGGSL